MKYSPFNPDGNKKAEVWLGPNPESAWQLERLFFSNFSVIFYPSFSIVSFSQGRHALVYDINKVHETWEWVDLKEVYISYVVLHI